MRYSWSKPTLTKYNKDMQNYKEEFYRREFENAIPVNSIHSGPIKKTKRFRSAFTTMQVDYLEKEFRKHPYIGNARRKDVSNVLDIPERAVKIWFQNRRMKEKKEVVNKDDDKMLDSDKNRLNNVRSVSIDDPHSLPLLNVDQDKTTPTIVITHTNTDNESKQDATVPRFDKTNQSHNVLDRDKLSKVANNVDNNIASPFKSQTEVSIESSNKQKYNQENTEVKAKKPQPVKYKQETKINPPISQTSPNIEPQSRFNPYLPTFINPEHMSVCTEAKVMTAQETIMKSYATPAPEVMSEDLPMYLKSFYPQPYISPGNMIWKPVNVPPIMSTGIPAVTVSNNTSIYPVTEQVMPKRSCNCDCHGKSYSAPMLFHQSNPSPHMQYLLTAVPYQNNFGSKLG